MKWQRAARRSTAKTPPATPPAIPLMCDVGDEMASKAAVFVAGDEVSIVIITEDDVVLGVDVVLEVNVERVDGVGEATTPKHETSVPFSTEKGNELAIGPPAIAAKNRYVPCATFTVGHVQLELDASRLDASTMYSLV